MSNIGNRLVGTRSIVIAEYGIMLDAGITIARIATRAGVVRGEHVRFLVEKKLNERMVMQSQNQGWVLQRKDICLSAQNTTTGQEVYIHGFFQKGSDYEAIVSDVKTGIVSKLSALLLKFDDA